MVKYQIYQDAVRGFELRSCQTYGFEATDGAEIQVIRDISTQREVVETLISILVCYDVSFEHLRDVVDDMFGKNVLEIEHAS